MGNVSAYVSPEGGISLEDMSRIVVHTSPSKQLQEFLFEAVVLVVLRLVVNISPYLGNLGNAEAERSISSLPLESLHALVFEPTRGIRLECRDRVGEFDGCRKRNAEMNVIAHSPGSDHRNAFVSSNPDEIGPELFEKRLGNSVFAVLRGPDAMDQIGRTGMRHLAVDARSIIAQ